MTVITIDRSTGDKLRGVNEPVQLRDERGEVLGEFRPAVLGSNVDVGEECPLDEAELQRREQEETLSTADVLRSLEAR
ncbi:MAG: hypothetical protein M3552_10590 [Planctomycetota bacterium]|nr:hypothetical protein [Planctomycetaceae bacterium]MDQ3331085.1 hypothetical protein [Planctomycetota bacterium]